MHMSGAFTKFISNTCQARHSLPREERHAFWIEQHTCCITRRAVPKGFFGKGFLSQSVSKQQLEYDSAAHFMTLRTNRPESAASVVKCHTSSKVRSGNTGPGVTGMGDIHLGSALMLFLRRSLGTLLSGNPETQQMKIQGINTCQIAWPVNLQPLSISCGTTLRNPAKLDPGLNLVC